MVVERIRALFEEHLPQVIQQRADLFDAVRGTLVLMVQGVGGWALRFGNHRDKDALGPASSLDGDCVAVFSTTAFAELLEGRTGGTPPVVIGEARLLARLGQLLIVPARGPLAARLNHAAPTRR